MNSTVRPRWTNDVPDLYGQFEDVAGYLTLEQVCGVTGLSVTTVRDLLSRPRITAEQNTLAPISRPNARIGDIPLYSRDQVDAVCKRQENPMRRYFGSGGEVLAVLTPAESEERGYASYEELATAFGIHENTLRKYWSTREDFPQPQANRERRGGHPGTPVRVFDANAVFQWLMDNGKIDNGQIPGNVITVNGRALEITQPR